MVQFNDEAQNAQMASLRHREEERLMQQMAAKHGLPYVSLEETPIDVGGLRLLSETTSREHEVAVFGLDGKDALVALRNPNNPGLRDITDLLTAQGYIPKLHLSSLQGLLHAWERYADREETKATPRGVLDVDPSLILTYSQGIQTYLDVAEKIAEVKQSGNTQKTSATIATIFAGAVALRASDIHLEPESKLYRVRMRQDGVLLEVSVLERDLGAHIVSRLKLLSGLKLNVKKEAQDGRFTFNVGDHTMEVRSSCIPGAYGESIVMRLLDPDASSFSIDRLGLSTTLRAVMEEELARPNGAILTTGPTGSGKTSALYSFLLKIHTPDIKVITLEDPVEYHLPGIVQTQIADDYTWSSGLRSILRQDPDVILVGEIRDREVAETAMHAAQTGHLVFSTLHTNSALGAFARLRDLGVDPETVGSAINIILGQRLVRRLCDHCKKERPITTEEQKLMEQIVGTHIAITTIFDSVGCTECGMTGYKGRIGVFEAVRIDTKIREAILHDTREEVLREAAKDQQIPTMQQDGILKVLGGISSLDEVSRVLDLYHPA